MRIVLSQSTEEAVAAVVDLVFDQLTSHPESVLGLATGGTMVPVYKKLAETITNNKISLGKTFFFMLDEYIGLADGHPCSFKSYITNHLILPLSLQESQFAFPPVHSDSLDIAGEHYEQSLNESGGIDLQLLGIGQNGHIGFNEPGSTKDSTTRRVKLAAETIEANKGSFDQSDMPSEALSMGIKTIMKGKMLVMLATGKSKADAIKYLTNNHDDPDCPATFLKSHPHFVLVLDPDAASKINLKI